MFGHSCHSGVSGIENSRSLVRNVFHNDTLQHGQVFHRGDVVQPKMVTCTNVGHNRHITTVKGQTFTQHATTRSLQNSGIHIGVLQHITGTFGATAVAGVNTLTRNVDPIGIGHPNSQTTLR